MSPVAYLAAQADQPELLDEAIGALSPLVGEKLLRPLADSLARRGSSGVTLVPAGILGLMPLHAIPWRNAEGSRKTLLDDFDVTFVPIRTPSSLPAHSAYPREPGSAVRFVGVANPLPHSSPLRRSRA